MNTNNKLINNIMKSKKLSNSSRNQKGTVLATSSNSKTSSSTYQQQQKSNSISGQKRTVSLKLTNQINNKSNHNHQQSLASGRHVSKIHLTNLANSASPSKALTVKGEEKSVALTKSPNNNNNKLNPISYICSGCNKPIKRDRFLLKACEKYWHENCLRCHRCHSRLGELGSTLYLKSNMNLCKQDYLELFGETGICSLCEKIICASEMVMRAKQNVYHLECFACQLCNQRFCVGDRFYLWENKVVCQYDYEEHITPVKHLDLFNSSSSALEPSITAPIVLPTFSSFEQQEGFQFKNAQELVCLGMNESVASFQNKTVCQSINAELAIEEPKGTPEEQDAPTASQREQEIVTGKD